MNQLPLRFRGGAILSFEYQETNKSQLRNMFAGEAGIDPRNGTPAGHLSPSSWVFPQKSGGMSSFTSLTGIGEIEGSGALGRSIDSSISGTGELTGSAALIVSAIANILASSTFNGSINAALELSASLAASGDLSASIQALADAICLIPASSALTLTPYAQGLMEAEITPFTELSPQSLAGAVWSIPAAEYNASGTMGEKLNSAGGSNSPIDIANEVWNSLRVNYNDPDSMGLLLKEISEELDKRLKKTEFIALK